MLSGPRPWYVVILENKSKTRLYTAACQDVEQALLARNAITTRSVARSGQPWREVYREVLPTQEAAERRADKVDALPRTVKLRIIAG